MSGFLAGAITAKLAMDKAGWAKAVDEVKKDQSDLQRGAGSLGASFGSAGKVIAASGVAIVGALTGLAYKTSEAAERFVILSEKTGISVERISALKYAAEVSDVPIETLSLGLKKLAVNATDAANGNEKAQASFSLLGVKATDTHGKVKPMDDLLMELSAKFFAMPAGPEKSAAAIEIFGRAGDELLPFLDKGPEGIKKLTDEAGRFGLVMSTEAAQAADNFGDQLTSLKLGLAGAFQQLALTLMPTLTAAVEKIKSIAMAVGTWTKEHPGLVKALGAAALGIGAVMTVVGPLLMILPKLAAGFNLVKSGIKGASLAKFASIAAWSAVIALAARYAGLLIEIRDAQEYERAAGERLAEVRGRLKEKLWEAAEAAGYTKDEFQALTDKYHGNIAAMGMAIEKGKEGVAIQESLATVGKAHGAVIDEQRKKLEEATLAGENKAKAEAEAKKITEEWTGFLRDAGVQTAATAAEIDKYTGYARELDKLLKVGKITLADYWKGMEKADEALEKFGLHLYTALPPARNFGDLMRDMKPAFVDAHYWGEQYDKIIKDLGLRSIVEAKQETRLYLQQQKLLNEAWREGLISNDEYAKGMSDLQDKIRGTGAAHEEVIPEIRSGWEGLYKDIAEGWGNVVSESLKNDWGLRGFLRGVWGEVKDTFFTYVGEMASKWAVSFLDDIFIKKTAKAAAEAGSSIAGVGASVSTLATTAGSVFSTIGTILTSLASAIGTAIASIATGIAAALVTIATAIAAAATTLAAAAPALLIVGGIALALFAGFKAIESLFGGGGGKSSDVTYWLKMMHADGKEVHDFLLGDFRSGYLNNFYNWLSEPVDHYRLWDGIFSNIQDTLWQSRDALRAIEGSLADLPHGAAGAYINEPTLMVAGEGAPRVSEILAPVPQLQAAVAAAVPRAGGGGEVSLNVYISIQCLDDNSIRDIVREKIGPEIVDWIRANMGKTPLKQALGLEG